MTLRLHTLWRCRHGLHLQVSVRWVASQASGKTSPAKEIFGDEVVVNKVAYPTDDCTNITPSILAKVGRDLHRMKQHPLYLIRKRIENFFYKYINRRGNPLFSVYDNLSPVVTLEQNFDSLLVPEDHVSRALSESYYVNSQNMLRAHTSAHQAELMRSGLDAFMVFGDVYRRDEIDCTHYPVFHQVEGVRLFNQYEQLFQKVRDSTGLGLFEEGGKRTVDKQASHSMETAKILEHNLKTTLMSLAQHLFGRDIKARWVDQYFPFTHPSWELEVEHRGEWLEVLGCGVIAQEILHNAGTGDRVGWAFGLGLERLAMKLYSIPDIRLFWSTDSGFLSQFAHCDPDTQVTYKPVSSFPQCANDLSFWLPSSATIPYTPNDFYDIVRNVGGDLVEQVYLKDEFLHPKKQRVSHCYRIVYRHMERTLTQEEVNFLHSKIEEQVVKLLGGELR